MKVILFNGSPRVAGCTNRALKEIAATLRECGIDSEIFHAELAKERLDEAAAKALEADGIILSSPVYYASASGLATTFFDELFMRINGKVRLKAGAAVVSCRRGGAAATFDQLNKYFTISEMVTVGSNYWNQVHGSTAEEVEEDKEGLQTMRILARNLAYVIKSFKAASLELPETEKKIKTNFIR